MIEILFAVHVVFLAVLFRQVKGAVGRVIGLVYFMYMMAFTVLKPGLLYYEDLYFPYSTNAEPAVTALLVGSLLFLLVQSGGLALFRRMRLPAAALRIYDFNGANQVGITIAFVVTMVISFIGCVIKFGNAGYLFHAADSFEAAINLANGSWYINYVAEALTYGMLMAVGWSHWRHPAMRSFMIMLGILLLTYFWARLAARTGILVVIVAWMASFFSIERQRRMNIIYIGSVGYILLILLYVLNMIRLGNAEGLELGRAFFGAIQSAAADLSPIDDAVLLYSEMHRHSGTDFLFLAGAITPIVLIPSSLLPIKLPADKDAELTRIFFPDGAPIGFFHENSTLTFTVPGSGYADFGYLGTIVASTIYVALLCWYMQIFQRGTRSSRFVAAYLIVVHILGFRLSIESLLIQFYTSLVFVAFVRQLALMFSARFVRVSPVTSVTL